MGAESGGFEGDYANLKIPRELVLKIDAYVKDNPWGYRSRAEVVMEAVRAFLRSAEAERSGWRRTSPSGQPTTAQKGGEGDDEGDHEGPRKRRR